jgi:hypothetical protein
MLIKLLTRVRAALLLLLLLAAASTAHAQKASNEDDTPPTLPTDPDTHLVAYTGVVDVPSTTQAQLYSRAYEWVVKTYNSPKDVIQMQDKESGKIIVKASSKARITKYDSGYNLYTFSIYVKEGKYKYDVTDLRNEHVVLNGQYVGDYSLGRFEQVEPNIKTKQSQRGWNNLRRNAEADIKALLTSLQAAMVAKDKSDF